MQKDTNAGSTAHCSSRTALVNWALWLPRTDQPHNARVPWSPYRVVIGHGFHLLVVICPSELSQALGVEFAAVGEELGAVLLGQLGAKGVDGDDEGSAIRFELEGKRARSAREAVVGGSETGGWGTVHSKA